MRRSAEKYFRLGVIRIALMHVKVRKNLPCPVQIASSRVFEKLQNVIREDVAGDVLGVSSAASRRTGRK